MIDCACETEDDSHDIGVDSQKCKCVHKTGLLIAQYPDISIIIERRTICCHL
jgi:hypothetical protein